MKADEKLRMLEPVIGEQAKKIHTIYTASNEHERRGLHELLDVLVKSKLGKDHQRRILLPPPHTTLLNGDYHLGSVMYPEKPYQECGLREDEWIKHLLIAGMTGSGKTNLVFVILDELRKKNKPFLVFDWKRNYRDLLQKEEFKNTLVFTVGQETSPLQINPLIPPPNIQADVWLSKLIDVISHAYLLGPGANTMLRTLLDKLYEQNGVFDGSKNFPTFTDALRELLKNSFRGRMMLWHQSAWRTLHALSNPGRLGRVANTRKQKPLNELLEKNVIIELDSLNDEDKTFFTEFLILWIYEYLKANTTKREIFNHALVIEEAHHILSRKKENTQGGETIMETTLRQIREFGESVIVIDQEPHKLSNSLLANTNTKICFTLGNGKDILDIGRTLNLNKEHLTYLDMLDVGQAIVNVKGRIKNPIHIGFPHFKLQKGLVSDEVAKQRMSKHDYSVSSAQKQGSEVKRMSILPFLGNDTIPPLELRILKHIEQKPFMGTKERYEELGLSSYKGNKAKNSLINKSLIKPVVVNRLTLYDITKEGTQQLSNHGLKLELSPRLGSVEHRYWTEKVKKHYESKGYKVFEEKHDIDLVAKKGNESIAIEVETGKSNIIKNITNALTHHRQLVIVPTNPFAHMEVVKAVNKNCEKINARLSIRQAKSFNKT